MFRYRKPRQAVLQMGGTFHLCTSGKPYPNLTGARTRADIKPLPKWNCLQLFIFTNISISTFEFYSKIYLELTRYWCVRASSSALSNFLRTVKKGLMLAVSSPGVGGRRAGAEDYMGTPPQLQKNETAPLCPPLLLVGWWGCQKNEWYLGITPHNTRLI